MKSENVDDRLPSDSFLSAVCSDGALASYTLFPKHSLELDVVLFYLRCTRTAHSLVVMGGSCQMLLLIWVMPYSALKNEVPYLQLHGAHILIGDMSHDTVRIDKQVLSNRGTMSGWPRDQGWKLF